MILVGTLHIYDFRGPERLNILFEKYKPRKVTLEFPSCCKPGPTVSYLETKIADTLEVIKAAEIPWGFKKYLMELTGNSIFELSTTAKYCKTNNAELHFVDYPGLMVDMSGFCVVDNTKEERSREYELAFQSTPNKEKWEKTDYTVFRGKFLKHVDDSYRGPTADVLKALSVKTTLDAKIADRTFEEKREAYLTRTILEIMPDMHIGGMEHIIDDSSIELPLYKRLKDVGLEPLGVPLCDAAKFC